MKFLLKLTAILMLVYLLFWGGVAAYFSYADRYKGLLESNLTSLFKRQVTIDNVETVWRGLSPRLKIEGFKVAGDTASEPALAFESLSAVVSPSSILTLWPSFTEFVIEKPLVEIVSLENNQLQIAGLNLAGKRRAVGVNQRVISWILDQQNAAWVDGEVIWRRDENRIHHYQDINIEFNRAAESRELKASVNTPKGILAFTAKTNGDLISDSRWDASLEVEGESGESLLTSEDFSVNVNDGHGRVVLKTLDVERIRDFIKLTGLAGEAGWLLDAKLAGRLHDVHLDFSGPLLNIETWSLEAAASDIGFKSVGRAPAMNNLSGELKASLEGGTFIFATQDSEFSWSRWYGKSFPIKNAMGEFNWQIGDDGQLEVSVLNGEFEDSNARISNIYAKIAVDTKARKVSNFGQLFKLKSVSDLSYSESGELVHSDQSNDSNPALTVDANAEFEVFDMSKLVGYLPNSPKNKLFRDWSSSAFLSGKMTNGLVSYKGELSSAAFADGNANLNASADFAEVVVDYAPKQNWPPVERASGSATVHNELLTIMPSTIWLNGDPLSEAELKITSLFQADRALSIRGKTTTSLAKGMDFLFDGPLIKPGKKAIKLPLVPQGGLVDIDTQVDMVLNDRANTKVKGTVQLRDGQGILPKDVPVDNINGTLVFTEQRVESDNVTATFLGGETSAQVLTVKEARPPVLKLVANGVADMDTLKPWIGEHLLTCFIGQAPWQGSILVDGGRVEVEGTSNLVGIEVDAPAPLFKTAEQASSMNFSMVFGGPDVAQSLSINYADVMNARFKASLATNNSLEAPSLFDYSLITIGENSDKELESGVNLLINDDSVNLDEWLSAVIDLAAFRPEVPVGNTDFLDAMRTVNIVANDSVFLNRQFGALDISAVSVDGQHWIGTLDGENINGTLQMQPRAKVSDYGFKLSHFTFNEAPKTDLPKPVTPLKRIDYSLRPGDYPSVSLEVDRLRLSGKNLGALSLSGKPEGDKWLLDHFDLKHHGINTKATGDWINNKQFGSISRITFNTMIDEAEGAFNEMAFDGIIRKGDGKVDGELRWIGAPHEFDFGRLNGEFDAFIKDGELVKVEPGGGKLLGLLNFNAIARRLVFDFRDVFATGLKFDRMRYAGVLADGEAILSEAFVLAPAVFVRMEGKVDLNRELVDLEVHVSPELGGNLALLSALANPAAGAFVYITQRIFKDEMRNASFKSYRALGAWADFEVVEFKSSDGQAEDLTKSPKENNDSKPKAEVTIESQVDSEPQPSRDTQIATESATQLVPEEHRLPQDVESSQLSPKL